MARSDELQLFSTSFIDLMACSLAGACILWVLTLDAEPAIEEPTPRRSVWVQVSQTGLSHFDRSAIEVVTADDTWTVDDFVVESPRRTAGGASVQFDFIVPVAGDDARFGGRAQLLVEHQREPMHLALAFDTCSIRYELHPIRIDWVDRDGAGSAIFFRTRQDRLEMAVGQIRDAATPAERMLLADLRRGVETSDPRPTVRVLDATATGADAAWQVKIGADGRVDLQTPPVDHAATAWLAGLLAGGGATP